MVISFPNLIKCVIFQIKFVSINSVSIIRNCRPVTIQIKLVLINYLSTAEETEAASEVELDAFTQTV